MLQTMCWFGFNNPASLLDIRQIVCAGVVIALHELLVGVIWPVNEIQARQQLVEVDNASHTTLYWAVVESLPVYEDIKKNCPSRDQFIAVYQQSLPNLATYGIRMIGYSFMPVLDWSRTNLHYEIPDGSRALHFVWQDFTMFDFRILKRPSVEAHGRAFWPAHPLGAPAHHQARGKFTQLARSRPLSQRHRCARLGAGLGERRIAPRSSRRGNDCPAHTPRLWLTNARRPSQKDLPRLLGYRLPQGPS